VCFRYSGRLLGLSTGGVMVDMAPSSLSQTAVQAGADDFLTQIYQEKERASSTSSLRSYETPLVTVDCVIFTVQQSRLKVLLIKRNSEPCIHQWALPGGFIQVGETLPEAAARQLYDETGVSNVYLQQIRAFGSPDRDPRARVITIGFFALVSSNRLTPKTTETTEDVGWFCINELPELAFDHLKIIQTAHNQLRDTLEETPIAFQLLPEMFTLTELQKVYELIESKPLDKRNFRKKILQGGLLVETGQYKKEGRHRPASLYRFASGMPTEEA